MIKIKKEYLDIKISCPATRQDVWTRFIPKELYNYYYNNGHSYLFEEDKPIEEIKVKSKNDISK